MRPSPRVAGPIVFFAVLHALLLFGGLAAYYVSLALEKPDLSVVAIFGGGAAQIVLLSLALTLRTTPLHGERLGRLVIVAACLLIASSLALSVIKNEWGLLLAAPTAALGASLTLGALAQRRGWRWTNEPIVVARPWRFSLADALLLLTALAACFALQRALDRRGDLIPISLVFGRLFFGGLCLAAAGTATAALCAGPRATLAGVVVACLVGFCFGALADGVRIDGQGRIQFRRASWRWGATSTAVLLAAELICLRQAGWRIDRPGEPILSTNPPTTPSLGE